MCSLEPAFLNYKTFQLNAYTSSKGAWITILLNVLVAKIYYFALCSNTSPNIFIFARAESRCESHKITDIVKMFTLRDKSKSANFSIHKKFAVSSECYGTNYKNDSEATCILLIKKLERYSKYFKINRESKPW